MNRISNDTKLKEGLKERFISYVKIWSESDEKLADQGILPSTPQQWDMAHYLEKELKTLGLQEITLTENCYVYAYLPASCNSAMEQSPSLLFMAHMDTSGAVSGKNVKPIISQKDDDFIISSDGTTLLGADDKAGIAAIMTVLEFLVKSPQIQHRAIEVMFSPDEETGHGMDKVPLHLIKSKCAYTVDGGKLGELESECFTAFSAKVCFTGKSVHPGSARELKMINAVLMASKFVSMLPHTMTAETTDAFMPYISPMEISGSVEQAQVDLILRAFSMEEIEEQKNIISSIANAVAVSFNSNVNVEFKQQYLNMKNKLNEHPEVLERLKQAYMASGVEIIESPIRGGTDGSRLTELGIPTPNIFTGGYEFHSRNEWCSLNQMSKAADVLLNLAESSK